MSRPYRLLAWCLPALAAFNVVANVESKPYAESWTICRNSAVRFFLRYGRDGIGPHTLYPNPERATLLLRQVEETGIFTMPLLCPQTSFPEARLVANMSYYVDRINVDDSIIAIEGWAGFPGLVAKPGEVNVVLRSRQSQFIFATLPVERADVGAAYPGERWRGTGFRFQRRHWLLPKEDFQIGLLINSERGAEMIMTAHRLDLTGTGRGILAGAE